MDSEKLAEKYANDIAERSWTVDSDFIDGELSRALLDDAKSLKLGDQFKPAGVGKRSDVGSVRRDEILWLDQDSLTSSQRTLFEKLHSFQLQMNEKLFLGLREFEAHFACYEPGAYYEKHVDRFRDDDRRTLSMVIYLNENWKAEDGGALKIFSERDHLISPEAGTMVCFLSDRIEHQVLESHRTRWSIAVWFKRAAIQGGAR